MATYADNLFLDATAPDETPYQDTTTSDAAAQAAGLLPGSPAPANTCRLCGASFKPVHVDDMFCSNAHRVLFPYDHV